ncbi:MAG: transcription antitermination factor NusB [Acidimicrobiales bacterium]
MSTRPPKGRGRPGDPGVAVRRLAIEALTRIDVDGAYANLALPSILSASRLDVRDRALATELVYGTTRMRRACDHLVDRFVLRDVDPAVRSALRLGAYQLRFTAVPDHAAVSTTVEAVGGRARGFVNAILRRVADADVDWPDDATRLSYPDWIVERLRTDLGDEAALGALEAMNEAPDVTVRADGYTQDLASQWVVDLVGAQPGERVADVCAAPGGKATGLARSGAWVTASDLRPSRVQLVTANAAKTGSSRLAVLVADAASPPYRPGAFDRVLVDAPCSGLGVLRRRPDARWRIRPGDLDRLAALQQSVVSAAVPLLRPGGILVYSVCTLSSSETLGVDDHLIAAHPELDPLEVPGSPWIPHGRGAMLLPQAAGTDGMMVLRLRAPD